MTTTISNTHHNDIEKGFVHHHENSGNFRPPIQLTPEQYEQLFLQPGGRAPVGDLSQRFGNPTALGIVSHLLSLTPTAAYLMQWGKADATSLVAMVGPYYFIGGLGLVLSGVMEWVLGNSFPSVVFISFGGFWLSLGALNDPEHAITGAFPQGASSVAYNDGLMFYFAFWAVACLVYFLGSLRTNLVFAMIFFSLIFTFVLLSAAYSQLGDGDTDTALKLLKAAGAFAWVCICVAWYLLLSLIFAVVDMPIALPLGDLSRLWRKRT
ncbi:hypothetical protein K435DRAFT_775541 [Dendrothele bispora CBS 962.96]|uniref:GPR1/FUN34/YaaH-class plasma membrane protein n=1 Tax=Dendrothele bispora (strain CBS 962.96) TaxID=1314807 RepID=A0A4S8MK32_DENBC|nr:hypothetical protein K435DRAFT_775541 [Dendrothele bispora CBS 962.96]